MESKEIIKIKHNIELQEDGLTLQGRILDVVFGDEGGERGGGLDYFSSDKRFTLRSCNYPHLGRGILYVWGGEEKSDEDLVRCKCDSETEANKILGYINEFTVGYESSAEIEVNKPAAVVEAEDPRVIREAKELAALFADIQEKTRAKSAELNFKEFENFTQSLDEWYESFINPKDPLKNVEPNELAVKIAEVINKEVGKKSHHYTISETREFLEKTHASLEKAPFYKIGDCLKSITMGELYRIISIDRGGVRLKRSVTGDMIEVSHASLGRNFNIVV